MAGRSIFVSIQLSPEEKEHLDAVARQSGKNRNRFLRDLIASVRLYRPEDKA